MAVQTSFQIDHNAAYHGMIADGQLHNIVSRVNTDEATIPFGNPVWNVDGGSPEDGTTKSSDGMFVGFAIREVYNRNYMMGTVEGHEKGRTMSVMNAGVMWIKVPVAVTEGGQVSFDTSTGQFVATGGTDLPGATWVTTASAGEFAKLRLTIGA